MGELWCIDSCAALSGWNLQHLVLFQYPSGDLAVQNQETPLGVSSDLDRRQDDADCQAAVGTCKLFTTLPLF